MKISNLMVFWLLFFFFLALYQVEVNVIFSYENLSLKFQEYKKEYIICERYNTGNILTDTLNYIPYIFCTFGNIAIWFLNFVLEIFKLLFFVLDFIQKVIMILILNVKDINIFVRIVINVFQIYTIVEIVKLARGVK